MSIVPENPYTANLKPDASVVSLNDPDPV